MKVKVRKGVFETNSSSTHTLVLATQDEYDLWKEGKYVADFSSGRLVPLDSLTDKEKSTIDEEYSLYRTYNSYMEEVTEYEYFDDERTLPDGTVICGFGYYGRD